MKELIDKLSLGIIDYDIPVAETDLENIDMSFMPEELYLKPVQKLVSGTIP